MSTAYIGLGSNLRNPGQQLHRAIKELAALADGEPRCSSFYRSAPVGVTDQPDFLNACCRIDTDLDADALLARLLEIEQEHGRQRSHEHGAPRTLDLDLLLYDGLVQSTGTLVLPHPRLHERAFVLYPLLEIDPGLTIPGHGPVAELVRRCGDQRIERLDADSVHRDEPQHGA